MNIIGALKKSCSSSTVYFCEYSDEEFDWEKIVSLLQSCKLMKDLNAEDIYCVAIESKDNLNCDRNFVGITFRDGKDFVSLVSENYTDIDFYLQELNGGE